MSVLLRVPIFLLLIFSLFPAKTFSGPDQWMARYNEEFMLELDVTYAAGMLGLDYTIGSPVSTVWVNYLISTYSGFQVIPLWMSPLPPIDPPVSFPASFPFPDIGPVGVWTALATLAGIQCADFEIIDTSPDIVFDLSPGTGPPPEALGGHTMTPVPYPGAPDCTGIDPPLPTPGGGGIDISPVETGMHRCIGSGWATWSHGYTGDVYVTRGGPQTIRPPEGTSAIYFYVEPGPFSEETFEVVADGVSSGTFSAHGHSGATYVGIYVPGGGSINTIEISSSWDFASGEFGWAD